MAATAEQIKKLRELTGAGVLDAKRTLEQMNGDFDKAVAVLKAKGLAAAEKKSERKATEGAVVTYVHSDIHSSGKLGAMVEVNCETDFVARTEEFQQLAHDLALQVAAMNPKYVTPEDLPAQTREELQRGFAAQAEGEEKQGPVAERIVQGKMENYLKENCLMRQSFVRDESVTVQDLVQSVAVKMGERIVVRRFARFQLGE